MSSSKKGSKSEPAKNLQADTGSVWGTVYSSSGEHSLGGVEHTRSTYWTEEDEAAYLERVKSKAMAKAATIMEEAQAQASLIKENAHQAGYDQGLADAQAELENFQTHMAESVSSVLATIEGQCSNIFSQWREDIIAVAKLAIEKVTCMELKADHSRMLGTILTEAIALLEKRREIVIRVNPDDEPVITDIITTTKEHYPDIQAWRVKADSSITPGGMVVESESSIAESRVESRQQAVQEILRQLSLPGVP